MNILTPTILNLRNKIRVTVVYWLTNNGLELGINHAGHF